MRILFFSIAIVFALLGLSRNWGKKTVATIAAEAPVESVESPLDRIEKSIEAHLELEEAQRVLIQTLETALAKVQSDLEYQWEAKTKVWRTLSEVMRQSGMKEFSCDPNAPNAAAGIALTVRENADGTWTVQRVGDR